MSDTKVKSSFKDLNKEELTAAAVAFGASDPGTEEESSVDTLRADLLEAGITWKMYAEAFKLEVPQETEDEDEDNIVRSENVSKGVSNVAEIITQEPSPALKPSDKYLVKMTRKNPYFEFRTYKFTQDNPYAIMTAVDAQAILQNEEGFRQAFPAELQEFYG